MFNQELWDLLIQEKKKRNFHKMNPKTKLIFKSAGVGILSMLGIAFMGLLFYLMPIMQFMSILFVVVLSVAGYIWYRRMIKTNTFQKKGIPQDVMEDFERAERMLKSDIEQYDLKSDYYTQFSMIMLKF